MENTHDLKNEHFQCPGYVCKSGATLYGIINSSGFVDYLKTTIVIDETFVAQANKGRPPEKRFRFAGNCAKSGCKQWAGEKHECGLIDQIIGIVDNKETDILQDCPIRPKCRWYSQRKGLACAQCTEVIRNIEAKMLEVDQVS